MIDAKDLNDAIQVASRIPGAKTGSVEVRPVAGVRALVISHQSPVTMSARERIDEIYRSTRGACWPR